MIRICIGFALLIFMLVIAGIALLQEQPAEEEALYNQLNHIIKSSKKVYLFFTLDCDIPKIAEMHQKLSAMTKERNYEFKLCLLARPQEISNLIRNGLQDENLRKLLTEHKEINVVECLKDAIRLKINRAPALIVETEQESRAGFGHEIQPEKILSGQ